MNSQIKIFAPQSFVGIPSASQPILGQSDFYVKSKLSVFEPCLEREIEIAFENVSNDGHLRSHLHNLDYASDRLIQRRLTLWLHFLNDTYFRTSGMYSPLVLACIIAAKECELFRTQTKHEFEISLEFLNRLMRKKRFLNLIDLESARFLLSTIMLVGSFPGMILRSINGSIDAQYEQGTLDSIKSLFERLFIKYETPDYLLDELPNLTLTELKALMFVLQGNSLRLFPLLPLPMSRKETWVIQNVNPRQTRFEKDILKREIVCSKLLLGTNTEVDVLDDFLENCKPFRFNLQLFIDDLSFWKKAYNLCCEIDWDAMEMSMDVFLDHLEYRRYVHEEVFILDGRSAKSLEEEIFGWQEHQEYKEIQRLRHLSWYGHGSEKWLFAFNGEDYQFSEIRNGEELFEESQNLKHCAYSYIQYCADGDTSVWSLKRKEDSFYKPYITIELQNSRVVQARGLRNRSLDKDECELLKCALEKLGFSDELTLESQNDYEF